MSETCEFCGQEITAEEERWISDEEESCHRRCLERKLVALEFKGVKGEIIDVLLDSFKPAKKKRRFKFF
ncbi:MAG: hypothetical protein RRB13_01625 [bacterium]|nr:hypothetical protein [bacterium]